jgi:hypothetical protein
MDETHQIEVTSSNQRRRRPLAVRYIALVEKVAGRKKHDATSAGAVGP